MKTVFEQVDIVWARLNASSLPSQLTGGVYKYARPLNSIREDVVINSLPTNNLELQTSVLNVNIFVPNIRIAIDNREDHTQPNNKRLQHLTQIAINALKDVWQDDYNFDVQQQMVFQEDDKTHYSNIRIDFYNINISN